MSALRGDARLRSLERAAAAGDVEAQARQLAERVRAGTLTRERLELAAYCGDAGARMALNVEDRASWPACGCEGGYGEDGPGACLSDGPIARLLPFVFGVQRFGRGALPMATWLAHQVMCDQLRGRERCAFDAATYATSWRVHDMADEIQEAARWLASNQPSRLHGETLLLERLRAGLLAWALGPDPELGNVADTPKRLAPYLHPTHIDPDPELPPTPVAALDGGAL